MADMVLSPVVRKLASIVGDLIVKEGSRLSRLQEDVLWIERETRHIQSYLEDVDTQQWGSRRVINFIRDVWDLAYDMEIIINTYFPKLAAASSGRNKWKRRLVWFKRIKCIRNFAVEIEGIKKRVKHISQIRITYGIEERSGRDEGDGSDPRRSFPHIDEENVVGFDQHIKKLTAKVTGGDLRCRVVSITGMPGVGKTTLAKKVYNSVKQRFQYSAWIYVSQQPNINELLQDIGRQVGLKEDKWKQNVEANLSKFLSDKRYVIAIDDIWKIDSWKALKNGIPTNSEKGSRIIITSRNTNLGKQVGGQSFLHTLEPLDPKNSEILFFKTIDKSSISSQLKSIAKEILKRCQGVPLVIVVTAGLLLSRERTTHAWKVVLETMGRSDEDKYSEIFALSYTDLPKKLKPCFLYFGLFPEDYEISAFQLINLWAAEGFIRGTEKSEVEDVGDDYLNHLIARNLVQVVRRRFNGKVRSCRIHDILHNLCIQVARDINFFNTHNDVSTHNSTLSVRRVTTHGSNIGDYISLNYQTPKLRAMLCFGGDFRKLSRNWIGDCLGGFKFLHVLNVKFSCKLSKIPVEIGNLNHLSYLGLGWGRRYSSNYVVELPYTISKLKNLLTLDLHECPGAILPNVIWNMKELRHILLPDWWCAAPKFYGVNLDMFHPIDEISLPNLQTLHVNAKIFKVEWLHKLPKLRKLQLHGKIEHIIKVSSNATPVSQRLEELWLSNDTNKTMEFRTWDLSQYTSLGNLRMGRAKGLPQHDKLPPNLTKLTLDFIQFQQDSMETLKSLPKLKILKLVESSFPNNEMVCSGELGNFPQLEVLKIISTVHRLELIIAEGGMPKLKVLNIVEGSHVGTSRVPDKIKNTRMSTRYKGHEGDLGKYLTGHLNRKRGPPQCLCSIRLIQTPPPSINFGDASEKSCRVAETVR